MPARRAAVALAPDWASTDGAAIVRPYEWRLQLDPSAAPRLGDRAAARTRLAEAILRARTDADARLLARRLHSLEA